MLGSQNSFPWALEKQDAVLLIVAIVVLFQLRHVIKNWNVRLPPGPPPLPLIGNLHQLSRYIHRDFLRLGKKYGPLMYLKMGSIPVIVVQNATYAREFTKAQDKVFCNGPRDLTAGKIFSYDGVGFGFSPANAQLRHMKAFIVNEVLSPRRLRVFKDQRQELLIGAVKELFEVSKQGNPVNLRRHLIALSYNIVTQMICGKTMYGTASAQSKEQEEFRTMMTNVLDVLPRFAVKDWFPFTRIFGDFQGVEGEMRRAKAALDQCLQSLLDDHRKAREERKASDVAEDDHEEEASGGFIDALLESDGKNDDQFTDIQKQIILQTLFIAGTEAASSTVEWTLAELLQNSTLMKKVQDEVDAVVGRDRLLDEGDLPHMNLVNAVVKETLRLHPSTALLFPRQGTTNAKVAGYDIPSNARIFINSWSISRDETSWENPLEFNPDRFLDPERPLHFNGSDHRYVPFGSGRRLCPGINLSLLLVPLLLATLLYLCDFSLPQGQKVDLEEETGASIVKKKPLEILVSPRLAPDFYKTYMAHAQ